MKNTSIIIPAFNEEATLPALIQSLQTLSGVDEIVVVNDCSTDQTAHVAAQAGARVISHPYQRGNGAAVKTALAATRSEWVMIVDGDGQHSIEDVKKIFEHSTDAYLVVGARPFRWYRLRDMGNLILRRFASLMSGSRIEDLTSGLRRLHRQTAMAFWHMYPEGYSFPSTSTILFSSSGYPVTYIPIQNLARPKHASSSKLKPFRQGVRFLVIIYRIALFGYPMRFFAPIGILFMFAGLSWTIRTISITRQVSAGGALLLLSGLTLLLFGTLADQMSHLRKVLASRKDV